MRKLWLVGVAIVVFSAVVIGLYYFIIYNPGAPRDDWPVLQAASTATDAAQVVVGPNVHVSASLDRFQYWECVVAAHPQDPARLFTAVLHYRGKEVDVAGFYSDDGGATWQLGCDLAAPPGKKFFDPTVAFGPDGALYLVHMLSHLKNVPHGTAEGGELHFHASLDGGKTWEPRAVVKNYIDRPWIAVDTTTGPHRGRFYCIGQINKPIVYTSIDGATTLAPPLTPLTRVELSNCRPANPAVMPDGGVLFVCQDRYVESVRRFRSELWPRPLIVALRSTDGGRTLTRSTPVNTKWWHDTIHSYHKSLGADFPQLAADPGSRRLAGRVYCVWSDGNDPGSARVFFCASPDGGATWGRPVVISEQPMDADPEAVYATWMPSIAVNKDGVVAVSWYDRRGLPKPRMVPTEVKFQGRLVPKRVTHGWNVRLRVSLDGGATWLPSVQLSEQPSQRELQVGHTAGLAAAADGRFHATWIDDRTGTTQLWGAAVEVRSGKGEP